MMISLLVVIARRAGRKASGLNTTADEDRDAPEDEIIKASEAVDVAKAVEVAGGPSTNAQKREQEEISDDRSFKKQKVSKTVQPKFI
jgi:ribosomal protein L14E/L6E/L27E